VVGLSIAGDRLVSRDASGVVRQWNLEDLRPVSAPMTAVPPLGDPQEQVVAAGLTGDGGRVVVVRAGAVLEWDANAHAALTRRIATVDGLAAIAASPAGDDVYAVTTNGDVVAIAPDGASGDPHPSGVAQATTLADLGHGTLAVGGQGLSIVDARTGERRAARDDLTVTALSSSGPAAGRLAVATDGEVRILSSADLSDVAGPFAVTGRNVIDVALAPDGSSVAVGTNDPDTSDLTVIDAATGEIRHLDGHAAVVTSVEFSPDGTRLASGSDDRTIILWSTRSWQPTAFLTGHDDLVRHLAFDGSGEMLLSGSDDGTMRWWDIAEQTEIGLPIRWDANQFGDIVAGGHLAASRHGSIIAFWDTTTEAWMQLACSIAPRPLTEAEERVYFRGRPPPDPCADIAAPTS
jgi:WD40 repeat protein